MSNECAKCGALEDALEHERKVNAVLLDRLMALVDARAYQAVKFEPVSDSSQYYGGEEDLLATKNEFGETVLMVKKQDERPV